MKMTSPLREPRRNSGFIQWLYGLAQADDRARLAGLRRGLMLPRDQLYELYRVVPPPFLDDAGQAEARRRLLLAALFAFHPLPFPEIEGDHPARPRNLGYSLRLLAAQQQGEGDDGPPETIKRRLDILLSTHAEDVFAHLQQVVRLLKSAEVPVDWERLLWDLRMWDREDRRVQWAWSRSFYVGPMQSESERGETLVS